MFKPLFNVKKQKIIQVFAEPVDYEKIYKVMEERAYNNNFTRILLNNKDASLVLCSFKHVQMNMKNEADTLKKFNEFQNKACFDIKRLFTNEASEFMGVLLNIVMRTTFY